MLQVCFFLALNITIQLPEVVGYESKTYIKHKSMNESKNFQNEKKPTIAGEVRVMPRIFLVILNITSWAGQCDDAEHVYGHLILSEKENVNADNVEEWNINHLGGKIEIFRPLTLEFAKALDKKEGGGFYQRDFIRSEANKEIAITSRFDTFEEVVNAGISKWRELDINCPFISLYEGEKYKANSYESSDTVFLQYGA